TDLTAAMQDQLIQTAREQDVSSVHILFPNREEAQEWQDHGFLLREDCQFHWKNHNYHDFEDFIATFTSKRRKETRRERRQAQQTGTIEWLSGEDLDSEDWEQLYLFYKHHACLKGGYPYLTRHCFSLWAEHCKDLIQVCRATHLQQTIAMALFFQGGDTLYGRYWGANDHYPCLHFELCYYQPIELCIHNGWQHFEAGAQGEHKLGRGLVPTRTFSAHWIEHPAFREAIAHAIEREHIGVQHYIHEAMQYTPHHRTAHDQYIE
ncbi:MAG: GNAT family N-acetyltransferase, partial [Gammaproteobacteria bacterium]